MKLHPFRSLHPPADLAQQVASLPYDVMSTEEARDMARGNAHSFLHVVRPEIDLPPGTDIHSDPVYEGGATALTRLQQQGALVRDDAEALWLYRLDMGAHTQVGFVGCANVEDYARGLIKRHEFTRPDKEDDRTRHVDTLGAHTGPVFLTCPAQEGLAATQERLMSGEPDLDVQGQQNVRHRLWRVGAPDDLQSIADVMDEVNAFYIADGHHRAASAWRVRNLRRDRADGQPGPWDRFLVVVFPADQLQVLAYNRVVADLNGHTPETFLAALEEDFVVSDAGAVHAPAAPRAFSVYVGGNWHGLTTRKGRVNEEDPVASLDVAILQDKVLGPLLGIGDPRTDRRIRFVGGIRGTGCLAEAVDQAGDGCAFSLYPTAIGELLRVADAGEVMPPKSTWFEPKLASGLMVNLID